jgi:outer membrane protein OmpA-like peptidoglycan-associated protein
MFKKSSLYILTSFILFFGNSVYANNKAEAKNEKYELHVTNGLSGAILAITDGVSKRVNGLNQKEMEKLNKFKLALNSRLQSDSIIQKIYFKTADDRINKDSMMYLNNLIYSLENYQNLNYELYGYSDSRGDSEYNKNLSLDRLQSIQSILLNLGINKESVSLVNFGEEKSESKSNYEDYFFDRRVEIKITK